MIELSCCICGAAYKVKPYRANNSKTCSKICRDKYLGLIFKGSGGPSWKGGSSNRTKEHKRWSAAVIERDGRCIECGANSLLQAHHVEHFSKSISARTDINNGITVCVRCHADKHPELPRAFVLREGGKSIKLCPRCGKQFVGAKAKQVYCSINCRRESTKTGHLIRCVICNKEVYKQARHKDLGKCCSRVCAGQLGRLIRYGKEKEGTEHIQSDP
jgi:hypothetical protein